MKVRGFTHLEVVDRRRPIVRSYLCGMSRIKRLPLLYLLWFFLWIAVGFSLFPSCRLKKDQIPDYNLLFITLDTTRADSLGVYGHERAETPILDSLASSGVMFSHCYAPVPLTLPSHVTMFTGKYPLATQVRDNGIFLLSDIHETLAERMKERDYHTFAVIGAFVLMGKFGLNQGFDLYDDSLDSHRVYNDYTSEIPASAVYDKFAQWFENNFQKKFFVWIHFYDPHLPYAPPKSSRKDSPTTNGEDTMPKLPIRIFAWAKLSRISKPGMFLKKLSSSSRVITERLLESTQSLATAFFATRKR